MNIPTRKGDIWQTRHDVKTTQETIKKLLWNGTPSWFSRPWEYKNMAKETFQAEKEQSIDMVKGYRIDDQEGLINKKLRYVNPMSTREFIAKLRKNGIRCFTFDNGMPGTVGLWAYRKGFELLGPQPICMLQIPAMIEWSILRLDEHLLPAGEAFRGWRTVLSQLIMKGVLTEKQAHKIFGRPTDSSVSRRYRRTLHLFRNAPRKRDPNEARPWA